MTSLLLLGWAAVVAVSARKAFAERPWTRSAPRLAIGLWLGAELSVTIAVLAAGLLLAVPPAALAAGLQGVVGRRVPGPWRASARRTARSPSSDSRPRLSWRPAWLSP